MSELGFYGSTHYCVVPPCPPVDPNVIPLLTQPSSLGSVWPSAANAPLPGFPSAEGRIPSPGPLTWADYQSIQDSFRAATSNLSQLTPRDAVHLHTDASPEISSQEMAQIDDYIEQSLEERRPVIDVYPGEAQAFREAFEQILSGAPAGYVPPPELNPELAVYDNPPPPPVDSILDALGKSFSSDLPPGQTAPEPGMPVGPQAPEEDEVTVFPPYIGPPVWIGSEPNLGEAPWEIEPDPLPTESGEQPMADLSDIFGNLKDRLIGSIDFDPRTPGIFDSPVTTSLPDIVGGFVGPAPTTPPTGSRPVATKFEYDPATGAVRPCHPRRRRRRLLTKSDIGDISTMAALLGKNSESFKVWLAKATR